MVVLTSDKIIYFTYILISFPLLWYIQVISMLTCKAPNKATAECFESSNLFNFTATLTGREILQCLRPALVLLTVNTWLKHQCKSSHLRVLTRPVKYKHSSSQNQPQFLISQSSRLTRQLKEEDGEGHNLKDRSWLPTVGAMIWGLTSRAWRGLR